MTHRLVPYLEIIAKMLAFAWLCMAISAPDAAAAGKTVHFKGADLKLGEQVLTLQGHLSMPSGEGPFPAVVLLPHCGGLSPNVVSFWPGILNRLGYATLVVDTLGARGLKRCPSKKFVHETMPSLAQDAYGALTYLAGLPEIDRDRVGAMGFSLGGMMINYFAGRRYEVPGGLRFRAGAALYSSCRTMSADQLTMPLTVINGALERLNGRCRYVANRPKLEFRELPNAYHAYDNQRFVRVRKDVAGNKMLYNAEATEQARTLVEAFFAKHLGKP